MKFSIQKYLSVLYLFLFVFQIVDVYSSTVKNFSIHSVNYLYGENNNTENPSDDEDLVDFESDDENEDNEENEEQEIDGESDYIEDLGYLALSKKLKRNYYSYFLSKSSSKKKEHFTPPEVIV